MLIFWIDVMKVLSVVILLISLTSCAILNGRNSYGGYAKAVRMSDDVWKVSYALENNDSMEDARNYVLLKAATSTIDSGFKYFVITQSNVDISKTTFEVPATVDTTTTDLPYTNSTVSRTSVHKGGIKEVTKQEIVILILTFNQGYRKLNEDERSAGSNPHFIYNAEYLLDSISDEYGFAKAPYMPPEKTHYRFHRNEDKSYTLGIKQD